MTNRNHTLALLDIKADTEACANCTHFIKHYNEDGWLLIDGHCTYPRGKFRQLNDTCNNFKKENTTVRY